MIKRIALAALLVSVTVSQAWAQSHTNRRRGAILGGLAGAAIGVAIGDKGNNETAGALIGGAVGAVAGGAIGDARDQRIDHDQRYHSGHRGYSAPPHPQHVYPSQMPAYGASPYSAHRQDYYAPQVFEPQYSSPQFAAPQFAAPPFAEPIVSSSMSPQSISTDDVLAMVRSGLSESMIVRQIQLRGVTRSLAVSEIISLHQQGVGEPIINAMQGVFTHTSPSDMPGRIEGPIQDGRSYRYPSDVNDLYGPSLLAPSN
ncbi:MAG: glycine zipper domain-containing protein [Rubripirellula sp.]